MIVVQPSCHGRKGTSHPPEEMDEVSGDSRSFIFRCPECEVMVEI